MDAPKVEPVTMEGVTIIFRNFTGKETEYNRAGERNFGVLLSDDVASAMSEDGWNVKELKPREDDEEQRVQPWLPVAVSYKGRPPNVVLITTRGRSNLDEREVSMLDWADITNVDLMVNPYFWEVNGKTGIKAYLRSIYVTINEDPLEAKYADMYEGQSLDRP